MASHIATEEWQSFELRMRRRRAERMLVRAEAALDGGCLEDASAALDEARHLCPSLPSLDDVQANIARASGRAQRVPIAVRVRRSLAVAAGLAIVATAGVFGWRLTRVERGPAAGVVSAAPAVVRPAPTTQPSSVTQLAEATTPANPPPAPSIRVQTEQVPPVVISGAAVDAPPVNTPSPAPASSLPASATTATPPPTAAADPAPARLVGTSGPTQPQLDPPAPPPADVGAIAALGREPALSPPASPIDRPTRVSESSAATESTPPDVSGRRLEPAPVSPSREPSTSPPVPKEPDDTALVRSILEKYADAYTRLDADAAKAVYPSVNRTALSRAFNGLSEQRIAFADCSVAVHSTQARATCSGSTTWEPKIGGGPRTDARRWAFDLEKNGDDWIIRDARVQNR